jgi:Raf kinase inhibitor-like YbhB/YbcL family protein
MTQRRGWLRQLFCGGLVFALLIGCASAGDRSSLPGSSAPQTMKLTSPAFSANGLIPVKYTCDGENISPALSWDTPPKDTRSFALIVTDPDAPSKTFVHWVLYDLPPDLRQLPEQMPAQPFLNIGGLQGKSDFGQYGYRGPCPPNGTHRYVFRLFALNQVMDLPPGTTEADLAKAIEGHTLATAELIGQYARQK